MDANALILPSTEKPVAVFSVTAIPPRTSCKPLRGIYAIRNRRSGNLYVGSSSHLYQRFQKHVSVLQRGTHHCLRLQAAWTKRGAENFEFIILEFVPLEGSLIGREAATIDRLSPAYNSVVCGVSPMRGRKHTPESIKRMSRARSPETRRKMSELARARYADPSNKQIRSVEIDGQLYITVTAAADALGISLAGMISRLKRGMGRYTDDPQSKQTRPWVLGFDGMRFGNSRRGSPRAVYINDQRFESCVEAAAQLGISGSSVARWVRLGLARYEDGQPSRSQRSASPLTVL